MKEINREKERLLNFIGNYESKLPKNVFGPGKGILADWSHIVWYFKDPDLGTLHRYLFFRSVRKVEKRGFEDNYYADRHRIKSDLLSKENETLLKIFSIHLQTLNISNNFKQQLNVVAAQILTLADDYGGMNYVSQKDWDNHLNSNKFWDFCKENRLLSGTKRPSNQNQNKRDRSVAEHYDKRKSALKMVSESKILALGQIFCKVFEGVNEEGRLKKGGSVDVKDALIITLALLGLAAPNRLSAEFTLLSSQKMKTLRPTIGQPVSYLDWKGSKGFSDNQNHILSVLSPYVKKAINFFHYQFKPERHYVRFLKNRNLKWEQILSGFEVDPAREEMLDYSRSPNLFTVAYALGFYPVEYEVSVLKSPNAVWVDKARNRYVWNRNWSSELGRRPLREDWLIRKNIGRISLNDVVINSHSKAVYTDLAILNTSNKTRALKERMPVKKILEVGEIESVVIKIQNELVPTFPVSYGDTDSGIDLESALFCFSPCKHSFPQSPYMSGSPLFISPLKRLITYAYNGLSVFNEKHPNSNLFYRFGYGQQTVRLHSFRHFTNTWAEKGGVPLAVIAAWSGRRSVNQTLEYIHTTEEEKAERIISTLELEESHQDIRIISLKSLKDYGGLPASSSDTGICVQELSVTPCNYINDFLSGCFGCESACYVCGDIKAIEMLEQDHVFQKVRLDRLRNEQQQFFSQARKEWWLRHSFGVALMGQLIEILITGKLGNLVRISSDRKYFFTTDPETKAVEQHVTRLPSERELLAELERPRSELETHDTVPDSMKSILISFGLGSH